MTGLVASLVPWASLPAGFVVSLVSDRTANRLGPLRLLLPAAAVALAGVAWSRSPLVLYGFLLLCGLVGQSATDPIIVAGVAEITAPERSATAFGFLNFFGMLASVVAPLVTGYLSHACGSMRPAFALAAGLFLVASVVLAVLHKDSRRKGAEAKRPCSPRVGECRDSVRCGARVRRGRGPRLRRAVRGFRGRLRLRDLEERARSLAEIARASDATHREMHFVKVLDEVRNRLAKHEAREA